MGTPRTTKHQRARPARASRSDAAIATHREQMLGRMLASILHEINNLLTPALTYCEMSKENPDDARLASDAARHSFDAIVGVRDVAATLLSLGRSSPTGDESAGELGDILRSVVACATPLARRRGVRLDLHMIRDSSIYVERTPVQHIALNLLLNAIAATPRGGTVRLSTPTATAANQPATNRRSTWNPRGQTTSFCIEDSGDGIPASARRVLVGRSTSGTSGLGLRVCASLARSMHADIHVDRSTLGGSMITVLMPLASPATRSRPAA